MKILTLYLALIVFFCHFNIVHAAPVYGQLTSSGSQRVSVTDINKPIPIIVENITTISGLSWDKTKNSLTILEDGVYNILSSLQVGTRQTVSIDPNGGYIFYWLEINGKIVLDSTSSAHVSPDSKADYIVNNFILSLKKDDVLRFIFSTTIQNVGLLTLHGTELRPDAPGFSASIFKFGDMS